MLVLTEGRREDREGLWVYSTSMGQQFPPRYLPKERLLHRSKPPEDY